MKFNMQCVKEKMKETVLTLGRGDCCAEGNKVQKCKVYTCKVDILVCITYRREHVSTAAALALHRRCSSTVLNVDHLHLYCSQPITQLLFYNYYYYARK